MLQVTQALGGHLQVHDTPDQKGRGVFTTQVNLSICRYHRTECLDSSIAKACRPLKQGVCSEPVHAQICHITFRLLRNMLYKPCKGVVCAD